MIQMQPPRPNIYTGEGFTGEKLLATAGLLLSIISTILLIDLTIKQRNHAKMEMDKLNNKQ
jgi:hypothetical protein